MFGDLGLLLLQLHHCWRITCSQIVVITTHASNMFGDFGLHHCHGWKLELCMYVRYSLQQQVNERDHCYLN